MSTVFDASVVVKWFLDDPLAQAADEARKSYETPAAPSLILVEVANALRRYVVRGELERSAARDNISMIPKAIELVNHDQLVDEAFGLACRLNHSMNDCIYAVLARRMDAPLITADGKFARKIATLDFIDVRLIDFEVGGE